MVVARKLATKEELRRRIGVSMPAFNEWQKPEVMAVPQPKMQRRIIDKLELTKAEREALAEAVDAQGRAEKAPSPAPAALADENASQSSITTDYTHLPLALGLMAKIPRYAPILELLPLWRGKEEDPTVEGWFKIGDEMLTTLRTHGAEGIGDADAGLGGGKLEALQKKGKRR